MAGCGSQASSRELRFSKTCHQHTTLHLRRKVSLFLESDFELNATNLGTKKIWALVQFFSPLSSQPFPLTMLPLLKLQQPLSYVSGVCVCVCFWAMWAQLKVDSPSSFVSTSSFFPFSPRMLNNLSLESHYICIEPLSLCVQLCIQSTGFIERPPTIIYLISQFAITHNILLNNQLLHCYSLVCFLACAELSMCVHMCCSWIECAMIQKFCCLKVAKSLSSCASFPHIHWSPPYRVIKNRLCA